MNWISQPEVPCSTHTKDNEIKGNYQTLYIEATQEFQISIG